MVSRSRAHLSTPSTTPSSRGLPPHSATTTMQPRSPNVGSSWKNVIDPETKLARGRHQDGSWITPFVYDKWVPYITESNAYQYTFYVPQDVPGLINTLGGPESFVAKLDGLFAKNLYDPGNEPGHQIPYLYDEAGAAWKTQERIAALVAVYNDTPSGIPGNDDAGQMAAWWIFSSLGFYPVAPGIPEYWIGTPLFPFGHAQPPWRHEVHRRSRRTSARRTSTSSPRC